MVERAIQRICFPDRRLLTVGLILLLLGLEAAVGPGLLRFGGLQVQPQAVAIAGALAAATIVALVRIEYGLLMLPLVAAAVPFSIGTGTATALPASLLFAAFLLAIWIAGMSIRKELVIVSSPVNLPLLGFTLTAVLAAVNSEAMRHPLVQFSSTWTQVQVGGLGVFVISAGTLMLAMNVPRQVRWVRWLVWVFLAVGAITVVGYLTRSGRDLPGVNVGGLFSMWVVALAFGQAAFNNRMPRWGRAGLAAVSILWLYRRFVLEATWLSGWMPAFAAVLVISILRSKRLSLVTLASLGIAWLLRYDRLYGTQVLGEDSAGNLLRLELWQQNLEVTKDYLWLGTGPAGYAPYYITFFPDRALSTHSNYLDIFAQTGLIGSFFFVWFLLSAVRVGLDARRQRPKGFAAGFANGVLGGMAGLIVAMALGDWLIPFVYNQTITGFSYTVYSWLFLGALAAVQRLKSD